MPTSFFGAVEAACAGTTRGAMVTQPASLGGVAPRPCGALMQEPA